MIDDSDSTAPRARSSGLVVRELEDEVLIFDVDRDAAHCLNRTAGLVWKLCDGRNSAEDIRLLIEQDLGTPVSAEIVWKALADLDGDHLLDEAAERPISRLSRRELMKRAGITVAVPVIASLAIPSVAFAIGSAGGCGGACTGSANSNDCSHSTTCSTCQQVANAAVCPQTGKTCCVRTDVAPPNGCTNNANNCLCCSGKCKNDNSGNCG